MAELNVPIYDFRHGVLTPKLKDRPNLDLYKAGVLVGENFLTQIHGPTQYRPGFIHSRTTRRNNVAHFIPFTFADDEAYILSFTEGYMRIFTDDGEGGGGVLTEDPLSITGITQANPGEITVVGNDFADGDEIYIDGCIGMTDLNGQFFLVTGTVTPGTSERNWPFSVPANYTYGVEIEVTAGVAQLVAGGSTNDWPFTTPGNYTYDSGKIEVTGGNAQIIEDTLTPYANWHMNESSGTNVADSSGNGRDGTTDNMEDPGDWVAGKLNNCLEFGGVNERVNFGNIAAFDLDEPFSAEIWYNTTAAGTGQVLYSKRDAGTNRGWDIIHLNTDKLRFDLISVLTSNQIRVETIATVTANAWHHVVVTYDGSEAASGVTIWIDGNVSSFTTLIDNLTGTTVGTQILRMGDLSAGGLPMIGRLDEAAIYDVELTADQVAFRYNSGTGTETEISIYDQTDPDIVPNTGVAYATALNSFVETSTIPGGDGIQYQISDDDGTTWYWWNGAAWAAITGGQTDAWYFANESNADTVVNTNISSFTSAGTFKFRAFLHSFDGSSTPQLDNVQVANIAYPSTNPTIETNSGFPFTAALEDFTETAVKPGTTELQYIVSIDDGVTYQYWTGAAWATSDGTYAQSNTAAVIDTNIGTIGASGTFKFKAFLHSSVATETPQLSNIHTQYTVAPSDTFSITDQDGNPIDTSGYDAYIGGGTAARVYEIDSPYLEADLPQLKFAQKADIMYIDHPSYAPRKLTRFGSGVWTLGPYDRTDDPFGQTNITGITNANPGRVTTDANHGFETGDEVLIENVNGMFEVNHVVFTITKVNDTNYTIGVDTSAYGVYVDEGVNLLSGDAPATVGFYGGRVFHGGSLNDPDLLFGSMSPDPTDGSTRYETFTVGSSADNAVSYALTSASTSSVDRIRFFMGTRQFLATGTYAGMLKVNGGSDSTPISGTAIESFPVDSFGVEDIMPVNFGTDIIYVQRGGEVVYSFKYTLLSDGWQSEDETLRSDEITANGIKQMGYQQGNPNQIWACMNDGRLLSFVYSDAEEVSAWNEHLVGGDGTVITVAAQPQEDNRDRVWIAVERTINGVTRRYVEYLAKNPRIPERTDFYTGDDATAKETDDAMYRNLMFYAQKRQIHLDSCLSLDTTQTASITPSLVSGNGVLFTASESIFSASDLLRRIQVKYNTGTEQGIAEIVEYISETAVRCNILQDFESTDTLTSGEWYFTQDTVDGLDHLEGETVSIVTDGGIHPDRVVSDGSITLVGQATYVMVGLFYFGRIRTMPLEILLSTGITPGKYKSVNKINLMFRNALGVSYGTDPYSMQRIGFREGTQFTDRPSLLYNGVKEQPGFDDYEEQRTMWIIQTVPYPCTLNSMVLDMEFSEEN